MCYIEKKIISKNYIYLVTFILICTKFVFSQNDISYENSWAVIIGIDDYGYKPLKYAVDDAQAIYNILITDFGFNEENIQFLINKDAISGRGAYDSYAPRGTVIVF